MDKKPRVFATSFGSVYPLCVRKAAKKGADEGRGRRDHQVAHGLQWRATSARHRRQGRLRDPNDGFEPPHGLHCTHTRREPPADAKQTIDAGPPADAATRCGRTGATEFETGSARYCVAAGGQGQAQCQGHLQNWAQNGPPAAAVDDAKAKCEGTQRCVAFVCTPATDTCKGTTAAANAMRPQVAWTPGSHHCVGTPNTPQECIITAPFQCDCQCLP